MRARPSARSAGRTMVASSTDRVLSAPAAFSRFAIRVCASGFNG
jgi:hypothetical protein